MADVASGTRPLALSLLLLWTCGCGSTEPSNARSELGQNRPQECPAQSPAPTPLPGIEAKHERLTYWLDRQALLGDLDEPLLSPADIQNHRMALQATGTEDGFLGQADLTQTPEPEALRSEVQGRLHFLHEQVSTGAYLRQNGQRLSQQATARFDPAMASSAGRPLQPSLHQARGPVPVHCGPDEEGLYNRHLDPAFDRNLCSTFREGEWVQRLQDWGDLWLVRSGYVLGWIGKESPLGPPVQEADASLLTREAEPLTRRAFLTRAFAELNRAYGWGGREDGVDCSRLVLNLMGSFGLPLPRHSSRQSLAGSFSIDVSSEEITPEAKTSLLRSAGKHGIVLLHFPGHIMISLGETEDGTPMALHAFSEYAERCVTPSGEDSTDLDTLRRVDRVAVSTLELGKGSSRGSFLERLTRITVFGRPPGAELEGAATERQATAPSVPTECSDSQASAIFRSPRTPHSGQPLRVIVTQEVAPGPAVLTLIDPEGNTLTPALRRVGGPPYTLWTEMESPAAGEWTAVLGDGTSVFACERFRVARHPPRPRRSASSASWEPRWRWEQDTENLYAAFVEQLFDYPIDDDRTWSNLQSLLVDSDRNLLYNHLSQQEDEALRLRPDCADLPYFLRAYFAWKTGLPFAFRRCSRGRGGRPPTCGEVESNLIERQGNNDVEAFSHFARVVRDAVHSASARTAPRDDATDNYPVPLTREHLKPGTVFADPYGHLLIIADWIPQGASNYGILVGADAQPDGTIGRRRFWRGSFLFTPETESAGPGFKAWRPVRYRRGDEAVETVDNATLRRGRDGAPWSLAQYEGTADTFYDRMESLINPRPISPETVLQTRIDALEESLRRRLTSVDNGTEYMGRHQWRTVEMPSGYAIFETRGAWEDYATPARDLRLLIALDAVHGFPDMVARSPARFGIAAEAAEAAVNRLRAILRDALMERSLRYTGSDGSEQSLTLQDVVNRRRAFEMAYNPNDCVERRWGAPEGSPELARCNRRAPRAQQEKMLEYREWFENRRRPPR